jgi:hypothetical protein
MTAPTLFTDIAAAIEEGDFIQNTLNKVAYLVCDDNNDLHVITEDQYARPKWETTKVLEIFQPY